MLVLFIHEDDFLRRCEDVYTNCCFFNSSLYFYKPVGSTTLLAEVCSGRDVCGPTRKIHFKNGKKIYMRQTIGKLHWEMG